MSAAAEQITDPGFALTVPAATLRGLIEGHVANGRIYPVMGCGLLVAGNGELTFTTYDLRKQLTRRVEGDFPAGTVALDAGLLAAALNGLDGEVTITRNNPDRPAELKAGRRRFLVPAVPELDLPLIDPAPEERQQIECDPAALVAAIRRVQYAVPRSGSEQRLQCLCIDQDAVAGVGPGPGHHRVAWATPAGLAAGEGAILVPADSVQTVLAVWPGDDDMAAAAYREPGRAVFVTGDATLTVQLHDIGYPNWRQIIGGQAEGAVYVDTAAFRAALSRLQPFLERERPERSPFVALRFHGGRLSLSGKECCDEVPAEAGGEPAKTEVWFNLQYINALAKGPDRLIWHPGTVKAPQYFQYEGHDAEWHVVMPVET